MGIIPEEQIHKSNIKVQTVFRITCLLHAKKTLTLALSMVQIYIILDN